MVEAAAMDLPFLAIDALRHALALHQPEIERDEIEGRADPSDGGDDVEPPRGKGQPVPENREIVHALPLVAPPRRPADAIALTLRPPLQSERVEMHDDFQKILENNAPGRGRGNRMAYLDNIAVFVRVVELGNL